ncbi:nuclear transport factor 2 family protein [Maribacter flavus]|uniref:Nuclear transport factor 2 family protein n=2 Tax=Maribacter flavus TaxID=1658664 RepID=A0A5B2TWF2_9FLAO|nr:nuclear transport factor 2 family protein [Maribacter flavus]KAA2218861.1 nuclear transport factor 2 family protein [Maribacter flavus]
MIAMKLRFLSKVARGLTLITLLGLTSFISAQNRNKNVTEIEKAVTELYGAMVDKEKEVLEQLTSENLSYGHSSGALENKSEYVNGVLNGAFQFSSITQKEQTVAVTGNVGVVRHIFEAKGNNNGKPAEVRIGCLLVFKKEGRWKLLARQAYKL